MPSTSSSFASTCPLKKRVRELGWSRRRRSTSRLETPSIRISVRRTSKRRRASSLSSFIGASAHALGLEEKGEEAADPAGQVVGRGREGAPPVFFIAGDGGRIGDAPVELLRTV